MTNPDMVKRAAAQGGPGAPSPNRQPTPPVPAAEGDAHPIAREEPEDSPTADRRVPAPNPQFRGPPKSGLSTRKD
ncbi:hypothetical protein [Methylobacterium oryzihabitans]|uniref:Uncharacterized protein n=1 Tax=Methylobacterium oryzihabitans TaxID=2499852 RepID=A0A3S2YL16_9HYPH|nr:hypothetical protein [Methylobacterium oryzihabitans]RVU13958.1 hypothetical protein EOE48_25320 [Methylobacterium oryzihabitans]